MYDFNLLSYNKCEIYSIVIQSCYYSHTTFSLILCDWKPKIKFVFWDNVAFLKLISPSTISPVEQFLSIFKNISGQQIFLWLFFFLPNEFFFNFLLEDLQCYAGFCCTTLQITHNYIYIPSWASFLPAPLIYVALDIATMIHFISNNQPNSMESTQLDPYKVKQYCTIVLLYTKNI